MALAAGLIADALSELTQAAEHRSPTPAPEPQGTSDLLAQIEQLAKLKSDGTLSEDEFAALKAKLLA